MNEVTCAIVTTFYPSDSVIKNLKMLEEQVSYIIIADNTPGIDNSNLFKSFSRIIYQYNEENFGLSMAFNKSLKHEVIKQSDFIIFFDQDSLIPKGFINELIANYNVLLENGIKVGCLGPVYYEESTNKIMVPKMKHTLFNSMYEVDSIITSAMLTTYNALLKINFWNEDIFLDMADWDLCWRFGAKGFRCCITENVVLNHKLGLSVKRFGPISIKEGTSIREYYQTRDCLKLLFKKYTPMKYKIRFILMVSIRPIMHILFLPEKTLRVKYIFLGVVDFFRSINGSFELRRSK